MMTNTNNTAALVTCTKCLGSGFINAFRHIMGGACFSCGGSGKVEVSETRQQEAKAAIKGKMIHLTLGGLDCDVFIVRFGSGFRADVSAKGEGRDGDLGCVWFDVNSGKVENVELSNGLLNRSEGERGDGWLTEREMTEALSGAYKGR